MKKLGGLVLGLAALLALPGSAAGIADCSYRGGDAVAVAVYTDGGRTEDSIAGVCVNTNAPVDGGYVEVGAGDGNADNGGIYAVADGSDANPGPTLPVTGPGYVALSNYEGGGTARDTNCDGMGADPDGGTNSGGCLWVKPLGLAAPVPLLACSADPVAPDWANTPEDGCRTFWPDS